MLVIRWVDEDLTVHESFISLYSVPTIDANTLSTIIKVSERLWDIIIRLSILEGIEILLHNEIFMFYRLKLEKIFSKKSYHSHYTFQKDVPNI